MNCLSLVPRLGRGQTGPGGRTSSLLSAVSWVAYSATTSPSHPSASRQLSSHSPSSVSQPSPPPLFLASIPHISPSPRISLYLSRLPRRPYTTRPPRSSSTATGRPSSRPASTSPPPLSQPTSPSSPTPRRPPTTPKPWKQVSKLASAPIVTPNPSDLEGLFTAAEAIRSEQKDYAEAGFIPLDGSAKNDPTLVAYLAELEKADLKGGKVWDQFALDPVPLARGSTVWKKVRVDTGWRVFRPIAVVLVGAAVLYEVAVVLTSVIDELSLRETSSWLFVGGTENTAPFKRALSGWVAVSGLITFSCVLLRGLSRAPARQRDTMAFLKGGSTSSLDKLAMRIDGEVTMRGLETFVRRRMAWRPLSGSLIGSWTSMFAHPGAVKKNLIAFWLCGFFAYSFFNPIPLQAADNWVWASLNTVAPLIVSLIKPSTNQAWSTFDTMFDTKIAVPEVDALASLTFNPPSTVAQSSGPLHFAVFCLTVSALTITSISQLRLSSLRLPLAERTLRELLSSPTDLLAKRPALFLNPHIRKITLDSRLQTELGALVMPGLGSVVSACAALGLMQVTFVFWNPLLLPLQYKLAQTAYGYASGSDKDGDKDDVDRCRVAIAFAVLYFFYGDRDWDWLVAHSPTEMFFGDELAADEPLATRTTISSLKEHIQQNRDSMVLPAFSSTRSSPLTEQDELKPAVAEGDERPAEPSASDQTPPEQPPAVKPSKGWKFW